ncbi:TNFAIP3-interacting protein 3 isoform X3 [Meriones unguiculatus]|uniref:TNFAIP3-interacting protein 3 isoform X3 n=1 Tax=Meriones unguiculatus TaxID=10047 RepID=UPI00293F1FF4|nr:TNFAIP3-interacting protein 3 isoform X3 [Meriones unguiculatus]
MELDDKIRDLIAGTPEATSSYRNVPSSQDMAGLSTTAAHMEHAECAPSRRKDLTNSLEQKIKHLEKQRQELLEVNQQWDQQFRNMKKLYERKVVELKTKLAAAEVTHALEKEQKQSVTEGDRQLEALQHALTIGSASLSEDSGKSKCRCSHTERRTEVESHQQQTINGVLPTSFLPMHSTRHMVSLQKGNSTGRDAC